MPAAGIVITRVSTKSMVLRLRTKPGILPQVHRLRDGRDEWTPRPKACFHVVRRTAELDSSHEHAALHSPLEWILPQTGESCRCDCSKLFRLQLHQDSSYTADKS